jgi:hypothetical protein
MPHTGDPCDLSGMYRSTCACGGAVAVQPGLFFPRCFTCEQPVDWELEFAAPDAGDQDIRQPPLAKGSPRAPQLNRGGGNSVA